MNKDSQLYQVLVRIENGIKRMNEQAAAVRWYLEADDIETAYDKALKLEAVTEKTTLLTRVLPAYTGHPRGNEMVEEIIVDSVPVEMGFTAEGWFCLRMPTLLPKKQSGSTEYIRGYLAPAMSSYFAGKPRVRYKDCVMIFRHVYDRLLPCMCSPMISRRSARTIIAVPPQVKIAPKYMWFPSMIFQCGLWKKRLCRIRG